ncbi:MAG TPA: FtsQ-type POTRA domain-containing protein [Propionibacteriaceae bacterium]|nr:FtsQ-type POTRA domain-containing protein [Propionibacteriaceae bacterium]
MTAGARRPHRATVVLLVAVLLLAVGTWVAYFSPLLVVREVAVAGERQVKADEVIAAAAVPMGTPLARQDVQGIAERATRVPAVQAASVTRQWPSTLVVTVTERQAVLVVRQGADFLLVDATGVAFDRVPSAPAGAVQAEADPTNRQLLADVGMVAGALSGGLGREVTRLTAASPDRISLELRSGVLVNWGNAADSPLKAQIVTALLKDDKPRKTIDVSSPNNPAVR